MSNPKMKIKDYFITKYYNSKSRIKDKEYFSIAIKKLEKHLKTENNSLIDIGGASGDFLKIINSRFPNLNFTLLDHDKNLIKLAKTQLKNCNFICDNFLKVKERKKYDIVTMFGVHSCFDEPEKLLRKLIKITNSKGKILIFGIFNNYDLDTLIYYKRSEDKNYNRGYNYFSIKSITNIIENFREIKKFSFNSFLPRKSIKKSNDKLRSWSEKSNKRKILKNGFMDIKLYFLTIDLK